MTDDLDTKQIWKSLSSAIDVEVREATSIRGSSGQDHPVQAVAVDEKTNRVVIFSAEPSPRIAALMQTDVQATLPGVPGDAVQGFLAQVNAVVFSSTV
jgi:hypothetical protein